jgi:hypothetical protein
VNGENILRDNRQSKDIKDFVMFGHLVQRTGLAKQDIPMINLGQPYAKRNIGGHSI